MHRAIRQVLVMLLYLTGIVILPVSDGHAEASRVILDDRQGEYPLGRHLEILEDPSGSLTLADVMAPAQRSRFVPSDKDIPGFGFSPSAYWLRVDLERQSTREQVWMLEFGYAPMQYVDVYTIPTTGQATHQRGGAAIPMSQRPYRHHKHVFLLELPAGETTTLLVRVAGESSKTIPLRLMHAARFAQSTSHELTLLGIYCGIIFGLFCYNVFVYRTIREPTYLLYLIFLAGYLTMAMHLNGLAQTVLFGDHPKISIKILAVSASMSPFFALVFSIYFLNSKKNLPSIHRVFRYIAVALFSSGVAALFVKYRIAVTFGTLVSLAMCVILIGTAASAMTKKIPSANYFFLAWAMLLIGTILSNARMNGFIAASTLTEYANLWGSAAEAILLSVGLAARMRLLKQEKDAALQLAISNEMKAIQNERIASASQKQMIKQEQLATLGLLSASVAHEINNPNQFVSVSTQNLEKRLDDLQALIQDLMGDEADAEISHEFERRFEGLRSQLALVKEGSQRISGIVKGMRNNSRQDLGEPQLFDASESLLTTLGLIAPAYKHLANFRTEGLQASLQVKGHASRLNQVFTNLIVNACHAIESKQQQTGDNSPGTITLWTQTSHDRIAIAIEDTGCGMTPEIKARLFEPFFTTKGADRGTGLGLGICRTIVEEHGGQLELESTAGKGSLFRVILPLASGEHRTC